MIIYEDLITGSELCSDAFKPKLIDDIVYEIDCATITIKKGADVDIGANPSAEEGGDEGVEDGSEQVINMVYSHRLAMTSFDKKSYLVVLKKYMKDVKECLEKNNPERVAAFEKGAAAYAKKIVANFKDFEFYTGEKLESDGDKPKAGMVMLLNYREDGVTPYFTIWKDGLKEVKV